MNLQQPPQSYSQDYEIERNRNIEFENSLNRKRLRDLELSGNERLILSSPDGTRYYIRVTNAGAFQVAPLSNTNDTSLTMSASLTMNVSASVGGTNINYGEGYYGEGVYDFCV